MSFHFSFFAFKCLSPRVYLRSLCHHSVQVALLCAEESWLFEPYQLIVELRNIGIMFVALNR